MSNDRKDVKCAFPMVGVDNGMELRDWFAGQVITEALRLTVGDRLYASKKAYRIADAMCKEREKRANRN